MDNLALLYELVEAKVDVENAMDVYITMKTFIHKHGITIGRYIEAKARKPTNQKDEENLKKLSKEIKGLIFEDHLRDFVIMSLHAMIKRFKSFSANEVDAILVLSEINQKLYIEHLL